MSVNCIDYSVMTVSNAALSLTSATPTLPDRARGCLITVETDQVRWRADGTAPTNTEGHLLEAGDVLSFNSWDAPGQNWRSILKAILFIRVTNDAKLKISWFD